MSKINNFQNFKRTKTGISLDNNYNYLNYYKPKPKSIKANYRNSPSKYLLNAKSNSIFLNKENLPRKNSFMTTYTEGNINSNYDIIQNLKDTLQITEKITNKFLNKKESFDYRKRIHKKVSIPTITSSHYNYNYNNKTKNSKEYIDYNFDNNDNYNYHYTIESEYNDNNFKDTNEEFNLISTRSLLMQSNIEIRKENRILETEINNYRKQIVFNNIKPSNNINYNILHNKEFDFLKKKLQTSIKDNTNILDKIFRIQQVNQNINKQIKRIYSKNENIFKKLEKYNRKNAENEILNEENELKYNQLMENKEIFKNELEKLKFELTGMKNNENNLKLLKNSNLKKISDTEEIIHKLESNINKLEEELKSKTDKINYNSEVIFKNNKNLNFYKNKIIILQNEINNINKNKNLLAQKNLQIKNMHKSSTNNVNNKYKVNEIKLRNEYKKYKEENILKKKQLKLEEI